MVPELRSNLQRIQLTAAQLPAGGVKESVTLQLQEIILALLAGSASKNPATTEGLCRSFKDWEGVAINPAIQEDSAVFFTRLIDKINEELAATPHKFAVKQTLTGTLSQQLIGTDPRVCAHSKSSPEEFHSLQLDVKNKATLTASLQAFIQGEVLSGDNAYRCSACNAKVSTLRRTVIAKLPKVLVLQLKRFEMDYHVSFFTAQHI